MVKFLFIFFFFTVSNSYALSDTVIVLIDRPLNEYKPIFGSFKKEYLSYSNGVIYASNYSIIIKRKLINSAGQKKSIVGDVASPTFVFTSRNVENFLEIYSYKSKKYKSIKTELEEELKDTTITRKRRAEILSLLALPINDFLSKNGVYGISELSDIAYLLYEKEIKERFTNTEFISVESLNYTDVKSLKKYFENRVILIVNYNEASQGRLIVRQYHFSIRAGI